MEKMKFDTEQMHRLARDYFAGEIDSDQELTLFSYLAADTAHKQLFATWRRAWEQAPAQNRQTESGWQRVQTRMQSHPTTKGRTMRLAGWWRAAAAVVIFGVAFFGARWYDRMLLADSTEYYTITTKSNDKSTICLPDGTQVRLSGASTLSYPINFNATNRRVELSGGAFFDVSPDKFHPFEVKIGTCAVTVKGTKFDIDAYSDESHITTTLLEGSVEFSSPAGTTLLIPGEALAYDRIAKSTTIGHVDTAQYLAWIEGNIEFVDVTTAQLCKSLHSLYGVEIALDEALQNNKTLVTIRLKNQESIDHVLKALNLIVPISVQREGFVVRLTSR